MSQSSGAPAGAAGRERWLGLLLVVVSAFGYGSGALFAKPVYASGVDWLTLSVWRFLFAALASWAWLLLWPSERASRTPPRVTLRGRTSTDSSR